MSTGSYFPAQSPTPTAAGRAGSAHNSPAPGSPQILPAGTFATISAGQSSFAVNAQGPASNSRPVASGGYVYPQASTSAFPTSNYPSATTSNYASSYTPSSYPTAASTFPSTSAPTTHTAGLINLGGSGSSIVPAGRTAASGSGSYAATSGVYTGGASGSGSYLLGGSGGGGGGGDDDGDGDDGDDLLPAMADDDYSAQLSWQSQTKDNLKVLMDNFTPLQYERFEAYRRHALPKQAVRKVIQQNVGMQVSPPVAQIVAGFAKVFVGEMVEKARAVQERRGEVGPLSPDHLREAYRMYQEETGRVGAARPLRAKKLFVR